MGNIAIIGGGIAGLNTAYRLLRKGHQVTLYEKQKAGIDKVCGEGVLPFGVSLLKEMGWGAAILAHGQPFEGLGYVHEQRSIEATFPEGKLGFGIDRGRLDRLMREHCTSFDEFNLSVGKKVTPAEVLGNHDILIGADGVQGVTARWAGLQAIPSARIGVRFRIPASALGKVWVYFFKEGEIYLTPTDSTTTSVAMLLNRNQLPVKGKDLKAFCLDFFRQALPHYAGLPVHDFATRGHIAVRWKGKMPRIILIGDALRAFDPISGAGMSFALLGGKLAAEHVGDPKAYYAAMARARSAIAGYTALVKFFSGGGWRTKLMFRQLGKAPELFERLVASHDGNHLFGDVLDWQMAKQILRV